MYGVPRHGTEIFALFSELDSVKSRKFELYQDLYINERLEHISSSTALTTHSV